MAMHSHASLQTSEINIVELWTVCFLIMCIVVGQILAIC